MAAWTRWGVTLAVCAAPLQEASADPNRSRVGLNGYFRVMARPDFQGGSGRLGYWNLYGRLLNEQAYAELDLRIRLLDAEPGTDDPWSTAVVRFAGGSVGNASPSNGSLADFRLSQLFVRAGNVLGKHVTYQVGTQDVWFGDLGLYDFRPSTIFFEMLGISARWQNGPFDVMVGVGDAGFYKHGAEYSPVINAGGYFRVSDRAHADFGVGGELFYEPSVPGSRNAPYDTPGIDFEDWVRGEVVERYLADNPGGLQDFPDPVATSALSGKAVAYLGFGNWGPLRWNSLYVTFAKRHPQGRSSETFQGQTQDLYVTALTDERYEMFVGNEMQLELIKGRWDLNWGAVYGNHWDDDNDILPTDFDRWYASGVVRTQVYATPTVHFLVESSIAREVSRNGNAYRNHGDSVFRSAGGLADSRGLEFGDANTRDTWQGKAGIILNPFGPGIYVRPSLRLLYGLQWSSQNNAFGNNFVESLSDLNQFGAYETHWHHVIGVEVEAWF